MKNEYREDANVPRFDAEFMARHFNTALPSQADADRSQAVRDHVNHRLSNAWRTPAGGTVDVPVQREATPEAAYEARKNRLSNAWKDGR